MAKRTSLTISEWMAATPLTAKPAMTHRFAMRISGAGGGATAAAGAAAAADAVVVAVAAAALAVAAAAAAASGHT